jgi:hypothetical protein
MNMTFAGLQEAANNDPEFRIAARFWNSTLRLDMGEAALLVRIREGRVAEVITGRQAFELLIPVNLFISAPAGEWQKFLEPVPKPFYVDLWSASTHHGFKLGGDMESFYAYYPAVRRLCDILRLLAHKA